MKRRLQQLLNETFEYDAPRMVLSGSRICLTSQKGERAKGAFLVSHPSDGRIRGFVYASTPRILLEQEEFFGRENAVRFQFDVSGLAPGETAEGVITVCTDLGQQDVHVCAKLKDQPAREEAPDKAGLARLAAEDWDRACTVFASDAFRRKMELEEDSVRSLYEALSGKENVSSNLEEFMIGCGLKESVDIEAAWTEKKIEDPEGTAREKVLLTASSWGYLDLEISSDARFLRPEKAQVRTAEFIGGRYELGFIVDSNFLHAGRNYGRMTIRTSYRTISIEVRVDRAGTADHRPHHVRQLMRRRTLELYQDFRMGRIDLRSWADRTESVLLGYKRAGGTDVFADLGLVFVMQADGRKIQAEKLLSSLSSAAQKNMTAPQTAFWLYLSTFFTRDPSYVNRVRVRIRQLQLANRSDWQIRWICMNLFDTEYASEGARLQAVLDQVRLGCGSPVMYLEGALILEQNPYLFHEVTDSMRLILNYASRHGMLTEQLALELASMEKKKPHYDRIVFRVLERFWRTSGIRDVLEAMCCMAIEGEKKSPEYHELYRAAVTREISVNGLYEYYLETMEECRIETMPEVIRRYFLCSSSLPWRRKAQIYRSISDSRERIPRIFSSMKMSLEKFLTDQLAQGHINQDLAVLYDRYLTGPLMTPRLAASLAGLLFTYQIRILNPNMRYVIAMDCRMQKSSRVRITEDGAQVRIRSDSTRILLEDDRHVLHASTSLYLADCLLPSPGLMQLCIRMAPQTPELSLFFSLNTVSDRPVTPANLHYFLEAVQISLLSEEYRKKIRGWLLDYYMEHPEEKTVYHFLRVIDADEYAEADPVKTEALLTRQGFYEQACSLVMRYGCEHFPITDLVRIVSQLILAREYEEDKYLLSTGAWCFFAGKYDEHIVSYLLMYYEGPAERMGRLWAVGKQYGLDTMNTEKKILSLTIFMQQRTERSDEIYASYRSSLGSRRLCQAYVILRSWQYLVKGDDLAGAVFDDMEADHLHGGKLPDVCALALLRHLSQVRELSEMQQKAASELLHEYDRRNIRLGFFRNFPAKLTADLQLEDRVFFEMTASPDSTVRIYFRENGSPAPFSDEVMRDVCYGIRVREFILFGGQTLECYTEEARKDGTHIFSGHRILGGNPVGEERRDTSFGRICQMRDALEGGDAERCRALLQEYRQMQEMAKRVFTLI